MMSLGWRRLSETWDLVSPTEFARLYRRVRPFTMCSNARLRALYDAVTEVASRRVPGDLVECGVARGGSAALMALRLQQLGEERKLWLFDTFAGLPAPTEADPDHAIAHRYTGTCAGSLQEVRAAFAKLGVGTPTEFVPGLFQQTLPAAPIERIAVLHIDGDWYDSVRACLENLYDKVSPGGVIQLDDYGYWKGARKAVDEFVVKRGIRTPLRLIDYSGRRLIKS